MRIRHRICGPRLYRLGPVAHAQCQANDSEGGYESIAGCGALNVRIHPLTVRTIRLVLQPPSLPRRENGIHWHSLHLAHPGVRPARAFLHFSSRIHELYQPSKYRFAPLPRSTDFRWTCPKVTFITRTTISLSFGPSFPMGRFPRSMAQMASNSSNRPRSRVTVSRRHTASRHTFHNYCFNDMTRIQPAPVLYY